jgi:flagellar motor switch protein FliN/FliY
MFDDNITPAAPDNLDLLLDMELPLTILLGRTRMPFGEVLDLGVGSTVELNRGADDGVDVVVNDHVVARGELVVVDGNYGIRITEVASRAVRLESAGTPRSVPASTGHANEQLRTA